MLWEWGLNGLAEAAELLVSELVTNAVQAAAGRDRLLPIRLHLSSDKERLLIEVWDADPRPPVLAGLGEDGIPALGDEGGRGLFLVAALSQRWNWYASRKWGGKVVWSELQLSADREGHEHGPDHLREGAPPAMSSPASRSSAAYLPEAVGEPVPAPVSAPGTTLPLRPQAARTGTRHWVPTDPEILRRVKAALTRLWGRYRAFGQAEGKYVDRESSPRGHEDDYGISAWLLETLAGLDTEARQAVTEFVVLHREFPAWAVWPPYRGRAWTAVRPASARAPGPDLPMVWVHAATSAELADQMRGVDAQLTSRAS